jgi:hypothetical protein
VERQTFSVATKEVASFIMAQWKFSLKIITASHLLRWASFISSNGLKIVVSLFIFIYSPTQKKLQCHFKTHILFYPLIMWAPYSLLRSDVWAQDPTYACVYYWEQI